MSTGFCPVGFSLAAISLTDFGTTVRRSERILRTSLPPWTCVPMRRCFLFTVQSRVTPRPCCRTSNKCASLAFPSSYHFSRSALLHEITPTIACHFHRGFEFCIPFVIVAFCGTRVGTGFLSAEGEQASKESPQLSGLPRHLRGPLPSPHSPPTPFSA